MAKIVITLKDLPEGGITYDIQTTGMEEGPTDAYITLELLLDIIGDVDDNDDSIDPALIN